MKILYVTHQFLPEYTGGTEILTHKTAKGFMDRGHRVSVFTGSRKIAGDGEQEFDHYTYEGVPVYRYRYFHDGARSKNPVRDEYNNLRVEDYFRDLTSKIKPNLVHIYHLHYLSISLIDISKELHIPVIFTATDYWLICPTCQLLNADGQLCAGPDQALANCLIHLAGFTAAGRLINHMPRTISLLLLKTMGPIVRFLPGYKAMVEALKARPRLIMEAFARVDKVLVATSFMEQKLIEFGLAPEKIERLPFGVEEIEPREFTDKGTGKALRVGFIGNLHPHKGAHVLCQAVRLLPKSVPMMVNIYGPQDLFPDYVRKLKDIAHNDPRICFCGPFPPYTLPKILKELDVLVVPSLWHENTPLVIHSAQAAKVPVVATNVGGIREVVKDGVNGLLFEREDHCRLADILLSLHRDRKILVRLSKNVQSPVLIHDYVTRLEEIYCGLLGST